MSAFDVTVRVGEASVEPISEGDKIYEAQLVLGILTLAQIGPEQFLPIPLGVIRSHLDKQTIAEFIKSLQKVHDMMDKRPDISIAQSLPENLR